MKYHFLHIETHFDEEWQKDLFDQELCDLGVDTIDGEDYYIPSDCLEQNRTAINNKLSFYHFPFSISAIEDQNWNAAWEAEHPVQELPLGVTIVPHCAFGAGYHETTSMMMDELINFKSQISNLKFNVLDHGTGTGVLAIFAKKLGASYVLANDIDDKSVENARENATLNNVDIDVRLGELSALPYREGLGLGSFHLILANIHRNILIEYMPVYASALAPGGQLWLSGFYETDLPVLTEAAAIQGLKVTQTLSKGEWRMMKCQK